MVGLDFDAIDGNNWGFVVGFIPCNVIGVVSMLRLLSLALTLKTLFRIILKTFVI